MSASRRRGSARERPPLRSVALPLRPQAQRGRAAAAGRRHVTAAELGASSGAKRGPPIPKADAPPIPKRVRPDRSRPCRRRRLHTTGAANGAAGRRTRAIAIAAGRRRVPAPTSASAWRTARRASGRRPVRPRSRLAWPTGRRALAPAESPATLARKKRPAPRAGPPPGPSPFEARLRTARRALALRRVPERATRAVATAGGAGRYRRMISHRASSVNVSAASSDGADPRKVRVKNITYTASEPDQSLRGHGGNDRCANVQGPCFITFASAEAAGRAIATMDNAEFQGRKLRVIGRC